MAFADSQANAIIKYGSGEATILLAGTVTKGDAIGYSDGWKRALATVSNVVQMRCTAGEDGVSGQRITAYFSTTIIEGSRFTGATASGALYVAEGTDNGKFTQTAPSTTGDANTIVGYALTATQMAITPNANVDSVA